MIHDPIKQQALYTVFNVVVFSFEVVSFELIPFEVIRRGGMDQFATQGARRNTKMHLPQGRIWIDLHFYQTNFSNNNNSNIKTAAEQHPENIFENN